MATALLALTLTFAAAPLHAALAVPTDEHHWIQEVHGIAPGKHAARAVLITPAGETIVVGSAAGLPGGNPPQPHLDALAVAYDGDGAMKWQRRIDLGQDESAAYVLRDPTSGDLFVAGTLHPLQGPQFVQTHWLVWRLAGQDGHVIWQSQYPPAGFVHAGLRQPVLDAAGGLVLTGFVNTTWPPTGSDVRVARFGPDGSFDWDWNHSTPLGGFNSPIGFAADPAGGVVLSVRDAAQDFLQRLDAHGHPLDVLQPGDGFFGDLVVDAASAVYVTRLLNGGGQSVEKRGAHFQLAWSVPFNAANTFLGKIAADPDGAVVVANSKGTLTALDASGNETWKTNLPLAEQAFDSGLFRSFTGAPDGEWVQLWQVNLGNTTVAASVARFDTAGRFLWMQGLPFTTGSPYLNERMVAAAAGGWMAVAGSFGQGTSAAQESWATGSVRELSSSYCFGDGSSGPCPCGNDATPGVHSGCTHGNGLGGRLWDYGISSLSTDTLRFYGSWLPGNAPFVLLQASASGPAQPLADGLLCLSGPLKRLYAGTASSVFCEVPTDGDLPVSRRSAELGAPIAPGSTRHYQLYCRQPFSLCGGLQANLTNALSVTWTP